MSASPPESQRKIRLRQFMRDIWDEGRVELCSVYIAPSYHVRHDPGDPWDGEILDLVGYERRLLASRAAFPDQKFALVGLLEDGGAIAVHWFWQACHSGEIGGFAATGKTIRMSGATVYTFDLLDRLTGHWQIADRLGVFQQLQRNREQD